MSLPLDIFFYVYFSVSVIALIEPTGIQTKPNQLAVNLSSEKILFYKRDAVACHMIQLFLNFNKSSP